MNLPISPQCYRYPYLAASSYDEDEEEELTPFLDLTDLQLSLLSGEKRSGANSGNICFSDSLEVIEVVVAGTDDSGQHHHNIWYKHSEMKQFRKQRQVQSRNLRTRRRIRMGDCVEGLEDRKSSKSVVKAVLSLQQAQEREGNVDPDVISCTSRSLSFSSVNEAIERGLRLQNDVRSIR